VAEKQAFYLPVLLSAAVDVIAIINHPVAGKTNLAQCGFLWLSGIRINSRMFSPV